jgi:hypothetical protein
MITKIISGGQTGADRGGLIAADNLNIPMGGWIPKFFLTEEGSETWLGDKYGLKEVDHEGYIGYVVRTKANVRDSDGTIRIAKNFKSKGEVCTLKAIEHFNKPYFDVDANTPPDAELIQEIKDWLEENNIEVLNVAGNRETVSPGICKLTVKLLTKVLDNELSKD